MTKWSANIIAYKQDFGRLNILFSTAPQCSAALSEVRRYSAPSQAQTPADDTKCVAAQSTTEESHLHQAAAGNSALPVNLFIGGYKKPNNFDETFEVDGIWCIVLSQKSLE